MWQPNDISVMSVIDTIDYEVDVVAIPIKERLGIQVLVVAIMIFHSDWIKEYDKMVGTLYGRGSYIYAPKKFYLDLKNRTTPLARPSIEEPPVLELKALPSHFSLCIFGDNTFPMIIADDLV